jgi:hypothetical protein
MLLTLIALVFVFGTVSAGLALTKGNKRKGKSTYRSAKDYSLTASPSNAQQHQLNTAEFLQFVGPQNFLRPFSW